MFPPLSYASPDGLLAVGGDLSPATLHEAYSRGIFPWPCEDCPMLWFSPPQRAILFFDELRINKRLARAFRSSGFRVTIDEDFAAVMRGCATPHHDEDTWISEEIIEAYSVLHREENRNFRTRSVEVWHEENLVGGLYGIQMNRYFCGESMFHTRPNASKFALFALVEQLREQGAKWLDCQVLTPHLESLGVREVPRDEFIQMLQKEIHSTAVRSISTVL
jgi:leucyl/phenylalanyl-tRNA--protein transferase